MYVCDGDGLLAGILGGLLGNRSLDLRLFIIFIFLLLVQGSKVSSSKIGDSLLGSGSNGGGGLHRELGSGRCSIATHKGAIFIYPDPIFAYPWGIFCNGFLYIDCKICPSLLNRTVI